MTRQGNFSEYQQLAACLKNGKRNDRNAQRDVLSHLLHSPDIFVSNYHIFQSVQNHLSVKHFNSFEDIWNWLDSWIDPKDESFLRHNFCLLPKIPVTDVANDGKYFESKLLISLFCNKRSLSSKTSLKFSLLLNTINIVKLGIFY